MNFEQSIFQYARNSMFLNQSLLMADTDQHLMNFSGNFNYRLFFYYSSLGNFFYYSSLGVRLLLAVNLAGSLPTPDGPMIIDHLIADMRNIRAPLWTLTSGARNKPVWVILYQYLCHVRTAVELEHPVTIIKLPT